MERFVWIGLAGACGTWTRYLVGLWAGKTFGTAFPYGTLCVNVAGCFLLAAVMHVALSTTIVTPTLRLALTTGYLGGLTTYSSFNYETTRLAQDGAWGTGLLNFVATTACCVAAGLLGHLLARRLLAA